MLNFWRLVLKVSESKNSFWVKSTPSWPEGASQYNHISFYQSSLTSPKLMSWLQIPENPTHLMNTIFLFCQTLNVSRFKLPNEIDQKFIFQQIRRLSCTFLFYFTGKLWLWTFSGTISNQIAFWYSNLARLFQFLDTNDNLMVSTSESFKNYDLWFEFCQTLLIR